MRRRNGIEANYGIKNGTNVHDGEYLVRGGAFEVLEGDWQPTRLVLFRFPDLRSVKAFVNDPEYQPLKALRHRVAKTSMVAVAGV